MTKIPRHLILGLSCLAVVAGCDVNSALERLSEARQVSSDLQIQFTTAADSANKAVMADTDDASMAFAADADAAKAEVLRSVDALRSLLQGLRYTEETQSLERFATQFAAYSALDRRVLDLAVENSNVKAQRLSFGPAFEAADAYRDSLEAIAASVQGREMWHGRALVATAIGAVREIQAWHAPHIAEPSDATMGRIDRRVRQAETTARAALASLDSVIGPASTPRLAEARAALDRFMTLTNQVIELSRRNTDVRSLALSLTEKGKLTTACQSSLRALRDALAKRGFTGTR
ncbi:MAG: hypothetical protein IT184_18080 [Acidobacteria bacterium]|nr:hypothetical protein [Acidobacteriota bacterium]